MLYDKKAEKKFRDLVTDFVEWMKTAQTEQGVIQKSAVTQEEDDDDDQIAEKGTTKESEQQRKQRMAIEK